MHLEWKKIRLHLYDFPQLLQTISGFTNFVYRETISTICFQFFNVFKKIFKLKYMLTNTWNFKAILKQDKV